MVAPVTGPFSVAFYQNGPANMNHQVPRWVGGHRTWYRQKRPYTLELFFSYDCTSITNSSGGDGGDLVQYSDEPFSYAPGSLKDRLYAKAYEKFQGRLSTFSKDGSSAAELGATIATRRQSYDMILDRAMRLRLGFRAATRGDLTMLKVLWGKHSGIRGNAKRQGSNVLEYSFGWAPLAGDLAAAVEKLGGKLSPSRIKVHVDAPFGYSSGWQDYGSFQRVLTVSGKLECTLRAGVRLTNPNTALLNQLGLTNPATILWEVVPWSFVVDYFVNVQVFLQSFTDLIGIELYGESHTFFSLESGVTQAKWDILPIPPYPPFQYSWERCEVTRTPGVPRPSLVVKLPWRLSWQRAATSIGLLLQRLK